MTQRIVFASLTVLLAAAALEAQGAPARPQPSAPPAPVAAPPVPPPEAATPAPAPPPANAVALCNDGSFVVAPATTAECATRGGVKLVVPPPRATPSQLASPAAESRATEGTTATNSGPPPADATMRCKDGTYLTGQPSATRCSANGGVAVILPVTAPPPTPPATRTP
ncbi:MAG: hypothetical protein WD771_05310 [Gemmatimonadaceae bacterium]